MQIRGPRPATMSPRPPPQLLIFLTLIFFSFVRSDTLSEDVAASPLDIELNQLRSTISTLETRIDERVEELKSKDDGIKAMEKNIEQKLGYIASLNNLIESLQKGSVEQKEKMYAKDDELSNQANNLRKEIEAQVKKKYDVEAHLNKVEKKIKELYHKRESLQKINDEQRTILSKIKHDILLAEEKLLKLKSEASLASEEVNQTYSFSVWTEHGRPGVDWAIHKASVVKDIILELAAPHIKEAIKFLKPYLSQISVTSKPKYDKLTSDLNHYTREIFYIYTRLVRSVMVHHTQVQDTVLELLNGHVYSRPLADKDVVWYLASAIFALPAIVIVNLYTSLVSYKPKKNSDKQHARRRAKGLRSGK